MLSKIVKNLLKKVIFGLGFLFFSGAQIDLISHSIHFEKPHTCYIGSCRKPMAITSSSSIDQSRLVPDIYAG